VDSELFGDFGADEVDETDDVAGFGSWVSDDEVSVTFGDFGTTDASPFQAGLFDELSGALAAWVFEDAAGGLGAERLNGFFGDPVLFQHLSDSVWVIGTKFEFGFDDQQVAEITLTVIEAQFVITANDLFSQGCQSGDAGHELRDFSESSSGISAEGTSDGSGNSREVFEAGKSGSHGFGDDVGEQRAGTGSYEISGDLDMAEDRIGQADDRTADTFVFDEDVGATAENVDRDLFVVANGDQTRQFLDGPGREKILSGATQPEPRIGCEWFITLENVIECVE